MTARTEGRSTRQERMRKMQRKGNATTSTVLLLAGLITMGIGWTGKAQAQDADGDGVPDAMDMCPGVEDGVDADADGVPAGCDCNDGDDTVYPGAVDICDGEDNDCDGRIDVHLAYSAHSTQFLRDLATGAATNPSGRTISVVTAEPGDPMTVSTGANFDIYYRAPVALQGTSNRVVRIETAFTTQLGDHDPRIGLTDGTNVLFFGLSNVGVSGTQYQATVLRGQDAGSAIGDPSFFRFGGVARFTQFQAEPFAVVLDFETQVASFRFTNETHDVSFASDDPSARLDPSVPWEVLLIADHGFETYNVHRLDVFQDAPSLGGGRDGDGDGWAAMCECDDSRATVFPGAFDVCNGIDDECGGDGDRITLFRGDAATLASDVARWVATNPDGAIYEVGDVLRVDPVRDFGIFYRRRLRPRKERSYTYTPDDDEMAFDLEIAGVPAGGADTAFHIGFTDGERVLSLNVATRPGINQRLINGSGGDDAGVEVSTLGSATTAPVYMFVEDTTTLHIRLAEGSTPSHFDARGIVRQWSPSRNLDLSRPIDLIVYGSTSAPTVSLGEVAVTQDIDDSDGDGICDALDACVGPDGLDGDGDGVGASCDCDDGNPALAPRAEEICDGVAQSCGGVDERVFLDVDGEGLLHSLARGDATNPADAPYQQGPPLMFNGPDGAIQYRLPLEGYDPDTELRIELEGQSIPSTFSRPYAPTIYLSDGERARGFQWWERFNLVRASSVAGTESGATMEDRTVPAESGTLLATHGVVLRIRRSDGQLHASIESAAIPQTSFRSQPWDLVEGPISLILTKEWAPAPLSRLRVSQSLPDADEDGRCDAVDRCMGFDDSVDGDRDGLPDYCDVCLGVDGPDLDADGYPAGCDCNDSDPSVHPGAEDVCDRIDQNCDGVVDRHVTVRARGVELLSQLGRGLAENPSPREIVATTADVVTVRAGGDLNAGEDVFWRTPMDLQRSVGGVQRFRVTIDRDALDGDHDLSILVGDGNRAFGVGLFDDSGDRRRVRVIPVHGADTGARIAPFVAGDGEVIADASPYTLDFVLGDGDPRVEVRSASAAVTIVSALADAVGAMRVDALSFMLVSQGANEHYRIRSVEVSQSLADEDGDGVCDLADRCPGANDLGPDADRDTFPDVCDVCPGGDDNLDTDGDGVPNACDRCSGEADASDRDGDGVPDACDVCPDDPANDSDGDMVCDMSDRCLPGDDRLDADEDGVPDACDLCPVDDSGDSDEDGTCDVADICEGNDRTGDQDGDGFCADRDCDDTRASVYPGAEEICDGFDTNCSGEIPLSELDTDGDLIIDCRAPSSGGCTVMSTGENGVLHGLLLAVGMLLMRRRRR